MDRRITKSAAIKALRTILQFALATLTVEGIEELLQALGDSQGFDQGTTTMLIGFVTMLYSFLHRRLLDPSGVPSLVDKNIVERVDEATPLDRHLPPDTSLR